jgi:4-amino-4-deoxy-L-arabinose transferase-like glycosyltransferase
LHRSKLAKRLWLLLAVVACAAYFYNLGAPPLVGPDEPRYAQVAREMYERGDLVTPTLAGQTWFEKPALLYWLMAAGYRLLGVTELAARLGSAVSGLLTVLLIALLARRTESRAVEEGAGEKAQGFGLTTATLTASTLGLMVFSRGASFDIVLTATVTLALTCFFRAELDERGARGRWLAGFWAGVGLSLLAKGLIGVVLPCGVVGLYLLLARRPRELFRTGWWWGVPLAAGVASLWYAPVIARHGWTFVDEFFVQHHFARYVSDKYHHSQPFYFYLPILLLLALPWTPFLVASVAGARRWNWRATDAGSRLRLFALAWMLVPVAFFSLSGSKLPGYILPALPGAALLAGDALARFVRGEGGRGAMRATGVLALLFAIAAPFVAHYGRIVPVACALAIAGPSAVAGVFVAWRTERRALSALAVAGCLFLTVMLIAACGLRDVAERDSVRGLLRRADARGYASLPVVQLHTIERTSEFYAAGRLVYDEHGEPRKFEGTGVVLEAARERGGRVLVLVPLEELRQVTEDPRLESELIGDNGVYALAYVKTK